MQKKSFNHLPKITGSSSNRPPDNKRAARIHLPEPNVRQVREEYGLSQDRFAKLVGIGAKTLVDWEEGRRKPELVARILLRVATRVHPRVFVASWLGAALIVVVAERAHHEHAELVVAYDFTGLLFGFVAGLFFMIGILVLRRRAISQAILGFYSGFSAAVIFILGFDLWLGWGSNPAALDGFEVLLLMTVGTTAGIVCTTLGCRTAHRH